MSPRSAAATYPWPSEPPSPQHRAAYADAKPTPLWLDALAERESYPPLEGLTETDLCIVGAGFTGLWAALQAKRDRPDRDVLVLEAQTVGHGASGRNGGFAQSSLTHGIENGLARFPGELPVLERLARENFAGMLADLDAFGIECDLELSGEVTVALEPHELEWLADLADLLSDHGHAVETFDAAAMRAEVASPLYRGGLWDRGDAGILDPGKLAAGLARAASALGVRICEHTRAGCVRKARSAIELCCPRGPVRAGRVLLATSAYPPLLPAMRRYVAPVYDYALVSEPLDRARRESLRWQRRQGIGESANQFHYYRLTADDRILWGGYDAVYRFRGPVADHLDDHDPSFAGLAQRFFTTFPQLEGVRFTHRWGGAIDTCSRFSVFFGAAHRGRVAYALGYTGLGVVASRFGARVALDLLDGRETEATRLRYVRTRPVPFPPEPLRTAVIQLTRNRLAAADRNQGRRGLWLRTLDRLGLGFDS